MKTTDGRIQWGAFKLLMVLSIVLVGLAFSVAPRSLATANEIRVMPLGDSLTYGVGSSTGGGYRLPLWNDLLAEGEHITYVGSRQNGPSGFDPANEGHPGWRIDQIADKVVGWLNTYQPQIILLHIGTNDILQNDDLENAPARLSSLIDQITSTAPNAMLLVAQIIPLNSGLNSRIIAYNAAIPGIVQFDASKGKHVQNVDIYDAVPVTALSVDTIHPTDRGYDLMANAWNGALLPLLRSRTPPTLSKSGMKSGLFVPGARFRKLDLFAPMREMLGQRGGASFFLPARQGSSGEDIARERPASLQISAEISAASHKKRAISGIARFFVNTCYNSYC